MADATALPVMLTVEQLAERVPEEIRDVFLRTAIAFDPPPPRPGGWVYILLLAGKVIYVGQSTDLNARIGSHVAAKSFDRIIAMPVAGNARMLNAVEGALIRHFRPPLNKSGAGRPMSKLDARALRMFVAGEDEP